MSSFSGSHKSLMTSSAEPHIIVGCPSCSTKFAVESSAVAALESPRFHCSRCDAVFGIPMEQAHVSSHIAHASENRDNPRWVLADPAKVLTDSAVGTVTPVSQPLRPSEFSVATREPQSPTARSADAQNYTPRIMNGDKNPEALSMSAGLSLLAQGQVNLSSQKNLMEENPLLPQPSLPVTSKQTGAFRHHNRPAIPPAPGKEGLSVHDEAILEEAGREASPSLISRALSVCARPARGLGRPCLCVFGAVCFLTLLTYSSRVSPVSTDALITAAIPAPLAHSVPKLPPSELAMKDLSLRFVRTPAREVVAIVSGQLINTSPESIQDVTLEALGFNERGEIVAKSRAPLRSALSNEKIADLNRDTIQKFQHALGARDASIAPSETVHFSVALLGDAQGREHGTSGDPHLSAIKYFSARVFSVR